MLRVMDSTAEKGFPLSFQNLREEYQEIEKQVPTEFEKNLIRIIDVVEKTYRLAMQGVDNPDSLKGEEIAQMREFFGSDWHTNLVKPVLQKDCVENFRELCKAGRKNMIEYAIHKLEEISMIKNPVSKISQMEVMKIPAALVDSYTEVKSASEGENNLREFLEGNIPQLHFIQRFDELFRKIENPNNPDTDIEDLWSQHVVIFATAKEFGLFNDIELPRTKTK